MTGSELTVVIASVLVTAFLLGWICHWIWARLVARALSDTERIAEMAERVHTADRARERAESARKAAEATLAEREAEIAAQLAEMQTRLDGAIEGREAALTEELRAARADAEISMEGLGSARAQVVELQAEIEKLRADAAEPKPATKKPRSRKQKAPKKS